MYYYDASAFNKTNIQSISQINIMLMVLNVTRDNYRAVICKIGAITNLCSLFRHV